MNWYLWFPIFGTIFAFGMMVWDIAITRKGLTTTSYVEGHTLIVKFFGERPSTLELFTYNGIRWALISAIPFFAYVYLYDSPAWTGYTAGFPLGLGIVHLSGVMTWKRAFKQAGK